MALVISAGDYSDGRIEGISVSNVKAHSENGVIIIGCEKNVRDIEIKDWTLSIGYGNNRSLFRPVFDLAPLTMRPAPDPDQHIPWLYASDAADIRLKNVRYNRDPKEARTFSVEAVVEDVDELLVD
jgi:hypothetical protein